MITEQPILITSIKTYVDLSKNRIISFNATYSASLAPLGVCNADTKANGYAPITTHGIALVEAGSDIFKGDKVGSDSQGRAVPEPFFTNYLGRALDGALSAGNLIRVILNIN